MMHFPESDAGALVPVLGHLFFSPKYMMSSTCRRRKGWPWTHMCRGASPQYRISPGP